MSNDGLLERSTRDRKEIRFRRVGRLASRYMNRRGASRAFEKRRQMLAVSTLSVNETFASLQGEGVLIGTPTFFVRLDGCPLRCSWCDTPYALAGDAGRSMTVAAIAGLARDFTHVVITGGEPLAQDIAPLVESLAPRSHVTVETSGTIFADLPGVSLFSLSPKVGSSGYQPKPVVLRKFCATAAGRLQFKFVIADDRDLAEALACVALVEDALPLRTPVVLQPESGRAGHGERYADYLRVLSEKVIADERWRRFDVRVLPQLHFMLWHGEAGR
jgi:7-carboxy-7-deazaguanine synthase